MIGSEQASIDARNRTILFNEREKTGAAGTALLVDFINLQIDHINAQKRALEDARCFLAGKMSVSREADSTRELRTYLQKKSGEEKVKANDENAIQASTSTETGLSVSSSLPLKKPVHSDSSSCDTPSSLQERDAMSLLEPVLQNIHQPRQSAESTTSCSDKHYTLMKTAPSLEWGFIDTLKDSTRSSPQKKGLFSLSTHTGTSKHNPSSIAYREISDKVANPGMLSRDHKYNESRSCSQRLLHQRGVPPSRLLSIESGKSISYGSILSSDPFQDTLEVQDSRVFTDDEDSIYEEDCSHSYCKDEQEGARRSLLGKTQFVDYAILPAVF